MHADSCLHMNRQPCNAPLYRSHNSMMMWHVACCGAESSDLDLGEEICAKADKLEARAVVLLHHGKGLMKEMVFGSITSFATRNCRRPLVVYYD